MLKVTEKGHGEEISKGLKDNVFDALKELGQGFLDYLRSGPPELEAWRVGRAPSVPAAEFLESGELLTDIYQESLSLTYRLLFLFYAEGRGLLPVEDGACRERHSLESIRDDIAAKHDDPDAKNKFSEGEMRLWDRLGELFAGRANVIPTFDGGLFDPARHEFLERFKVGDYRLARAIDLLSRTRPGAVRGEGRRKVTYRDLDIRHLGSIYEGILEYHAAIAREEKAVVRRGVGGRVVREYAALSELTPDELKHLKAYREALAEGEESPSPPKGCKVEGLVGPGEYYLVYGGRESKRKSSGSYYTPDYIVRHIVENTLGPLVRGERRPKAAPAPGLMKGAEGVGGESGEARPLTSDEILELKVLDPAMGSGHFLLAATEYLASAYGAARARERKDAGGATGDDEFVRHKRMVAERCIYGVDINPTAVELAKLSMWLFTMDRGRPLSFLDHHLKNGNALVGAWAEDLGSPREPESDGGPKKRERGDTRAGNLFEARFMERVPKMVADLLRITGSETRTIEDVRAKKALDEDVEKLKLPFRNIADIWVGLHFGERADDYNDLLLNVGQARGRSSAKATSFRAFHPEIEFPEVFFEEGESLSSKGGFDAVIGNPPWGGNIDEQLKFFRTQYPSSTREHTDSFKIFVENNLRLTRPGGYVSMIVPSMLLRQRRAKDVRALMLRHSIISLVDLGEDVFAGVVAPSCIFTLAKRAPADPHEVSFLDLRELPEAEKMKALNGRAANYTTLDQNVFQRNSDCEFMPAVTGTSAPVVPLGSFDELECKDAGINYQRVNVGMREKGKSDLAGRLLYEGARQSPRDRMYWKGSDIDRYWIADSTPRFCRTNCQEFIRPNEVVHLNEKTFDIKPKILLRQTADRIIATMDYRGVWFGRSVIAILPRRGSPYRIEYFLGLLNSKYFERLYRKLVREAGRVFAQVKLSKLKQLPMRTINFSDPADRACHDNLVGHVEQLTSLHGQFATAKPSSKPALREEINAAQRQADYLVYELYELSHSEVALIEGPSERQ